MKPRTFSLDVRGEMPQELEGRLLATTGRRLKDRNVFRRWHDSPADVLILDVHPGRPGTVTASTISLEHAARRTSANHAVNIAGERAWATNLHFGAPVEIDLACGQVDRELRVVDDGEVCSTAHFAWTPGRDFAYFHQAALADGKNGSAVRSEDLRLVELETSCGRTRSWRLVAPKEEPESDEHNFHAAFYFEREGRPWVGLLRTGAIFESVAPHPSPEEHAVIPMRGSSVWIVPIDREAKELQAQLLEGSRLPERYALSHLAIEHPSRGGFVLYANYKQADIGEETHGVNIFGEPPGLVSEHYVGMGVEAFAPGEVIRYDASGAQPRIVRMRRAYDHARTGDGHTWLPIGLARSSSTNWLFASFAGFRPRLLPRHVASVYGRRAVDEADAGYVPPLLARLDAETLEPDREGGSSLAYGEPVAFALVEGRQSYVCTLSTEHGLLRVYRAEDLSQVVAEAVSAELTTYGNSHFRSDPAHLEFAPYV